MSGYDDDDYYEESGGSNVGLIIGIILFLFIIGMAVGAYFYIKSNKTSNIDIIYPPEQKEEDIDVNKTVSMLIYWFNLTPGTGHWNFLYLDERLLDTTELNGYVDTKGRLEINLYPTSEFSKKITLYANTVDKTGGYIVGEDASVPTGSVVTAVFYTVDGGKKYIIANANGSVRICSYSDGYGLRACTQYDAANKYDFTLKG